MRLMIAIVMAMTSCTINSSNDIALSSEGGNDEDPPCLCNCPDGVPARAENSYTDFCKSADNGETCCFWRSVNVLLVGECIAQVCVVPIKDH